MCRDTYFFLTRYFSANALIPQLPANNSFPTTQRLLGLKARLCLMSTSLGLFRYVQDTQYC